MSTLTNLFATLARERALLLEVVQQMPDEALTRKGVVGAWSIKNLLAHLADQERLVAQVLPQRLTTGIAPQIVALINSDADAWHDGPRCAIIAGFHVVPAEARLRDLRKDPACAAA
jgi:hypothetical protein